MTGKEFYEKYKYKKVTRQGGVEGIVIGYHDKTDSGIMSITSFGSPFSYNGWKSFGIFDKVFFDDGENPKGYIYISKDTLRETHLKLGH